LHHGHSVGRAAQGIARPDPILVALKAKLEHEFQKLDPIPAFSFFLNTASILPIDDRQSSV
jgi:hypothetical protein